jgi:hypothetical protein
VLARLVLHAEPLESVHVHGAAHLLIDISMIGRFEDRLSRAERHDLPEDIVRLERPRPWRLDR